MSAQPDPVAGIVARRLAELQQPPVTSGDMVLLATLIAREAFETGYEYGYCEPRESAEELR